MALADKLVDLFLGSMRTDTSEPASSDEILKMFPDGIPDAEAMERGIVNLDKMLTSEDAVKMMMGNPAATYVCLAMALEDRPKLELCSLRTYEKAIEYLGSDSSWERCMVLKQLGAVCVRKGRYKDALRWLGDCASECTHLQGHPRDANILNGSFNTKETRMEFSSTVEKIRAQSYYKLGDQEKAMEHLGEAQRMEAQAAGVGDAVERVDTEQASRAVGSTAVVKTDVVRELWAATPKEERRLKQYSFADEGSTVVLILDLNEHLGIGDEASAQVESLRQFRVHCENSTVDIQLRLRRKDGNVWHFWLHLEPLTYEIVPEDTVPKLRGKEAKRRLEVKLFKRDKQQKWYNDIIKSAPVSKPKAAAPAQKNTLLNPLTAEELSKLPTPSVSGVENRPCSWNSSGPMPLQEPERLKPAPASVTSAAGAREDQRRAQNSEAMPEAVLDSMD